MSPKAPPPAPRKSPGGLRRVKLLYQLLAVLLLVGVGPLVVSSRKLMQINQSTIESGILTLHTEIVGGIAQDVETFLERVRESLLGMARFQGLTDRVEVGRRPDTLIPFLDSYDYLLGLRVVDAAGVEVASVTRTGASRLWDQIGAAEVAAAVAGALRGELFAGTTFAPEDAASSSMAFAVPVRDEQGRVLGALLAVVSLADLQELVAKVRVGSTGQAYLVDRHGAVIAHRDLGMIRRRENLSDLEIVGYLQTGQTVGVLPFRDRNGRDMLGAYDVVPETGWGVVIEELRDEAYRSLHEMRRQTTIWVVLGLVLAVAIGVTFARGISRPIQVFAQKSLAIARGDFKGQINIRAVNEIGQLAETFNHMTEQLDLYDRNMRELFLATIKSLAAAIDAKDPYTRGHSERVALYSIAIGRELGLDARSLERLQIAALLHDVGKIGIEDKVLRKPAKLTEEEYALIKRHPVMGANIMGPIRQLKDIIPGMRHHHEALDGTGYPDGLAGGEIPLISRVIAVADTFDAMTSDRLYQKAKPDDFVIATLRRLSGTRYDPKAVQAFVAAHPKLRRTPAAAPADAQPEPARTA